MSTAWILLYWEQMLHSPTCEQNPVWRCCAWAKLTNIVKVYLHVEVSRSPVRLQSKQKEWKSDWRNPGEMGVVTSCIMKSSGWGWTLMEKKTMGASFETKPCEWFLMLKYVSLDPVLRVRALYCSQCWALGAEGQQAWHPGPMLHQFTPGSAAAFPPQKWDCRPTEGLEGAWGVWEGCAVAHSKSCTSNMMSDQLVDVGWLSTLSPGYINPSGVQNLI